MSNLVRQEVEAYFASLNPTAKRMMADISNAKEQQGSNWEVLSVTEQESALWEALVNSEVSGKYQQSAESLQMECFPVLRVKSGGKIVVDEEVSINKPFGASWRDEHSAPFRWETQSQLNLSLCGRKKEPEKDAVVVVVAAKQSIPQEKHSVVEKKEEKKEDDLKRHLTIKRPEVPPPPVPPHSTTPCTNNPPIPIHGDASPPIPVHHAHTLPRPDAPIYAKVVKRKSCNAKTLVISEMKAHKKALQEMKPAVPPRMSLELQIDIDPSQECPSDSEGIPKTGFDFLDNW